MGLHIESLPLEVGQLDDVTIDQGERTDPGTSELVDGEGTQGTTTDNHDVGGGQRVLTAWADATQERLSMMSGNWIHDALEVYP